MSENWITNLILHDEKSKKNIAPFCFIGILNFDISFSHLFLLKWHNTVKICHFFILSTFPLTHLFCMRYMSFDIIQKYSLIVLNHLSQRHQCSLSFSCLSKLGPWHLQSPAPAAGPSWHTSKRVLGQKWHAFWTGPTTQCSADHQHSTFNRWDLIYAFVRWRGRGQTALLNPQSLQPIVVFIRVCYFWWWDQVRKDWICYKDVQLVQKKLCVLSILKKRFGSFHKYMFHGTHCKILDYFITNNTKNAPNYWLN